MKCANCGTERSIGKFCPECGSQEIATEKKVEEKAEIKCGNCGRIRARGTFCPDCGSEKVYVEPQVMVCSDCGTVRKSGKFCSECGSTNITYKPASLYENTDIQEPVYVPKITAPEPVKHNTTVVKKSEPIRSIDNSEELTSVLGKNINISDDLSPVEEIFVPIEIDDDKTELLKNVDDIELLFADDPIETKTESVAPLHDSFTPVEPPAEKVTNDAYKKVATHVENKTVSHTENKSVSSQKSDDTQYKKESKADQYIKKSQQSQAKLEQSVQPPQKDQTIQTAQSYTQNQNVQSAQSYQQNQNAQPVHQYQQELPSMYYTQSYTQAPYKQSYPQYNDINYDYSFNYNINNTPKQPRPRNTTPLTPAGVTLKKCRIAIFILTALEFIAMFLPAATYGNGLYSESVSLSDGHGFIIFVGLIILTILAILAGFSNYVGCAIGLLIQSLILSIASFFIVALVSEDRSASKGIAYYIFLIVPIIIIIISIAVVRLSIRLKVETTNTNQL